MAKNAIREYSSTPSANTDIGGTGIQGSNAVSNFDNAFRTIMAQLADMNGGISPINDTFTLCDPADPTKRGRFDFGAVATATTRVITWPNANFTFSAFSANLLDDADAAAMRATLVLGTSATINASVTSVADTIVQRSSLGAIFAQDVTANRGGGVGVYNFATGGTAYLAYSGGQFEFQGGHLLIGTARYQTDGNIFFSGGMATAYGSDLGAALTARAVVYTGTGINDTVFPIGHSIAAAGNIDRNASTSAWLNSGNNLDYTTTASGAQLAGTYRGRGRHTVGATQLQRTA